MGRLVGDYQAVLDGPDTLGHLALESGKLRGAYLNVYAGELSGGGPPAALRNRTNVVITPHISGVSDSPGPRGFDLFLVNLERLISGEPLKNVIDWERGY